LVLAFGPSPSAWGNALIMTGYTLAFALPWIVLSLRGLIPKDRWYGLFPVLLSGLNTVTRWALYGFFFGYFYAYLKGRSGLHKALWSWAALVTPALLATVMFESGSRPAWLGLAFWALQLLITFLLLGLVAGDLETLRRAGFRWRHVVEVHNMAALSAWAGALVIAIGTTASTILASGAGTLVTAALRYAGILSTELKPPHP